MSDLLVEMSDKAWFRQAVKSLGLPLPTPQRLARAKGPRSDRPLADADVVVSLPKGSRLGAVLAGILAPAGANPHLVGVEPNKPWRDAAEAFGRPVTVHPAGDATEGVRAAALIIDGSGFRSPSDLRALYDFFHAWLPRLKRNGRVVVLGRPAHELEDPAAASAALALDGFVRSINKEIGRKGSTAHALFVSEGAEGRVDGLLRFLLARNSAYIGGQPWYVQNLASAPEVVRYSRPLDGLNVLLTGAARGIGAAAAAILAAEGAHVIGIDRPGDEEPLAKVMDAVGGTPLAVDITDADAAKTIAAFIREHFGQVHGVIHNAGITRDKTLARMKPEWWDQAVAVNLGAVVDINAVLLDGLVADGGRIVCLSSVAGLAGNAGQTNYAASKAGLVGYVRALAGQIASRGITVNAVAPGFIETRLTAAMPAVNREVGRRLSALGQGGLPDDVAQLITFLTLPASSGLTGQVVRVCGGMFIGA